MNNEGKLKFCEKQNQNCINQHQANVVAWEIDINIIRFE